MTRPNALSWRREDRPTKADVNDDCIKNRIHTVLLETVFDPKALVNLLQVAKVDLARLKHREGISLRPIDLILLAINKPIDKLINTTYTCNVMVTFDRDFGTQVISEEMAGCQTWHRSIDINLH